MRVKFYKEFLIGGPAGDALRDMVHLAARCEMAAALHRTRAVREVVSVYDARCESQLRRRGLLGFDDVKFLMGEWVKNEDARRWISGWTPDTSTGCWMNFKIPVGRTGTACCH
jgi:hypothetical protein